VPPALTTPGAAPVDPGAQRKRRNRRGLFAAAGAVVVLAAASTVAVAAAAGVFPAPPRARFRHCPEPSSK
jgi:hypothetical protein